MWCWYRIFRWCGVSILNRTFCQVGIMVDTKKLTYALTMLNKIPYSIIAYVKSLCLLVKNAYSEYFDITYFYLNIIMSTSTGIQVCYSKNNVIPISVRIGLWSTVLYALLYVYRIEQIYVMLYAASLISSDLISSPGWNERDVKNGIDALSHVIVT